MTPASAFEKKKMDLCQKCKIVPLALTLLLRAGSKNDSFVPFSCCTEHGKNGLGLDFGFRVKKTKYFIIPSFFRR